MLLIGSLRAWDGRGQARKGRLEEGEIAAILPMNLLGLSSVPAGAARGLGRFTGWLSMGWAWVLGSGWVDGSIQRQRLFGDELEAVFGG